MFFELPKGNLSFVERWPLMNPNDVIFLICTYLIFILKIGPALMERREPFQMKGFLVFYNIVKVMNSTILAFKFLAYVIDKGLFPRKCEYDDRTVHVIAVLYWKYMATKILDLFDTVFFVLRKKASQITFLHVYHHVFMVIISWSSLKYDPSDHWAFMAVLNCTIHAIMYTYYGLSAMGPTYAKYLWWKKYLTLMQLLQFVIIILHIAIQTYTSPCPMSKVSYWVGVSNLVLFMWLFTDFYRKNYNLKRLQFVIIILHIAIQTYTSPCPMSKVSYWVGVSNLVLFMWLFTDFYRKNYNLKRVCPVCTRQAID